MAENEKWENKKWSEMSDKDKRYIKIRLVILAVSVIGIVYIVSLWV